MRFPVRQSLPAALLLLAAISLPLSAQNPAGSIRGTVTDPQGAVIYNASVTVSNQATGDARKASTSNDGSYSVDNLPPGEYQVRIEHQGFATQLLTLTVQVGNATSGDASLIIGSTSQVINVTADTPIIDKSNYKVDGVITRQKVEAMPLNGRNFLQLALLEPGVAVSATNPGGDSNNLFNVSVGGAPASLTRITVDGASVIDPATGFVAQNFSTETIQEFQISTFNFDLSTGITSVGAINIVSRTGTNLFQGSAFVFFRDRRLSAFPGLERSAANPEPAFRRFQYGGAVGGPIKKDRAHFFVNLEGLNQDAAFTVVHTGFAGFSQFNHTTISPYDGVIANGRTDFRLNDQHNLFARYSHDSNSTFAPSALNTLPSNWRNNSNHNHNVQVGAVSIFRPNLVNDLRFSTHRIRNDSLLPTVEQCPPDSPPCLGLGNALVIINNTNLTFGNSFDAPQFRQLNRYQTVDNLNWQKASHRLRFGGEWEHNTGHGKWAFLDPAVIILHDPRDVMSLNAQIATLPEPFKSTLTIPLPRAFTAGGALTINDILQLPFIFGVAGIGDPVQPPPFNRDQAKHNNRYRFYAQDSWLARPGFTLSYGLAYQFESNLLNHDLKKPLMTQPLLGKTAPSGKDFNNVAPAVGFAWDAGNKGRTVIRGGAGIYYDTILFITRGTERATIGPAGNGRAAVQSGYFRNTIPFPQIPNLPSPINLINPPLGVSLDFRTIPTKFTGAHFLSQLRGQTPVIQELMNRFGAAGFTGVDFFKTAADPSNVIAPDVQTPYAAHFSLGVQRQLPQNMSVSIDVVLRQRVHTLMQNDFNLFNRAKSRGGPVIRACDAAESVEPSAQCSNGPIEVLQSSGRDRYQAMLLRLDKRFTNRYQFTAAYALSSLTGYFTTEDQTDWFANYGPLDADARHRFTFSGIAELPLGFRASLIGVFVSRAPFNARLPGTIDVNGDGTFGDTLPGLKVNSLGRGIAKFELHRLIIDFNENFAGQRDAHGAFISPVALPAAFEFSDRFQSYDVRFSKTVKFSERRRIEGFVEVFNLLNIANLGGYSQTLDGSFGQPTQRVGQNFGIGGPRALQIGGRFTF
jgi:hypothetical protein